MRKIPIIAIIVVLGVVLVGAYFLFFQNNSNPGGEVLELSKCAPDWECFEWSQCNQSGIQTRTCTDLNSCGTIESKPRESEICVNTETCSEDWMCADWSLCNNEQQVRTCIDENNCGTIDSKPSEMQSCQMQDKPDIYIKEFRGFRYSKSNKVLSLDPQGLNGYAWVDEADKYNINNFEADYYDGGIKLVGLDAFNNDCSPPNGPGTYAFDCFLWLSEGLSLGEHSITIILDPRNKIEESNENNNEYTLTLQIDP